MERFQARFGKHRVVTDPMESAYFGAMLWAQAINGVGSAEPSSIREAIKGQAFDAPGGPVQVDPATQHTSKVVRIGKILDGRRFEVVYTSEAPIAPIPYPATRSRADWDHLLADLYRRWGGAWANPA